MAGSPPFLPCCQAQHKNNGGNVAAGMSLVLPVGRKAGIVCCRQACCCPTTPGTALMSGGCSVFMRTPCHAAALPCPLPCQRHATPACQLSRQQEVCQLSALPMPPKSSHAVPHACVPTQERKVLPTPGEENEWEYASCQGAGAGK